MAANQDIPNASSDPLIFTMPLLPGDKTPEEEAAELAPLIAPFIQLGFRPTIFITVGSVFPEGWITHDQFVKLVKCFAHLSDIHLQSLVYESAIRANKIRHSQISTIRDVIVFLQWLRTREGQNVITTEQRLNKIMKKAKPGQIPLQIALTSGMNKQLTAISVENKRVHDEFDPQICELKRQIEEVTAEMNRKLMYNSDMMVPAGMWKEPNPVEFQKRCYAMMRKVDDNCPPKGEHGFGVAVEKFGDRVRQDYQMKLISSDYQRQELRDWLESMILRYRQTGRHLNRADKFNKLLVSIGGNAVVTTNPTIDGGGKLEGRESKKRPASTSGTSPACHKRSLK